MGETVGITIPARAEHLLVVRLAASGVCSRLGMGIEQMEDAKAAAAEACLIVINGDEGYARLEVAFEFGDGLWVTVRGAQPVGQRPLSDEIDADLSLALLEALADDVRVEPGYVRFHARGAEGIPQ